MELLNQSLIERFQQYFDVDFAASPEQVEAVHRIRYRVYCEELQYEPARLFPDGLEIDEFDGRSLHCLITHRSSGTPAGCVRLVSTSEYGGRNILPFEKNCPGSVPLEFYSQHGLRRDAMCEISRLAVDPLFRRRSGESKTPMGEVHALDCSNAEKRTFSLIAIAGFLGATALTDISGRTQVFAMMEPFMPPLMQHAGFGFRRAGQYLDYHGQRAPYFIRTEWAVENLRPDLRELYDAIHERMVKGHQVWEEALLAKACETAG